MVTLLSYFFQKVKPIYLCLKHASMTTGNFIPGIEAVSPRKPEAAQETTSIQLCQSKRYIDVVDREATNREPPSSLSTGDSSQIVPPIISRAILQNDRPN